jgi:hypothetical protein
MTLGMRKGKLAEAFGLTFQQAQKYVKGANRMGASLSNRPLIFLGSPCPSSSRGRPAARLNRTAAHRHLPFERVCFERDGLRLVKALVRISRPAMRHRIVALVNEMVGEDGGSNDL